MKSPFKFLDAYAKEDRDIFFGREKEIEELYHRVFDSRIMLIYGESGTGKSSLIQCGLANKFRDSDWLPLMIRRGDNLPDSIARTVKAAALTPIDYELLTTALFKKAIRSLYIDYYKPIFFIFDQFEELFIFGTKEEKQSLLHLVHALTESDIECRFIFVMREEYFASVTEFEKYNPGFLSNRVRIEKMPLANAITAINGPCGVYDIEVEEGFAEKLLKKLNPDTPGIELTWLQVYLDKIFSLAASEAEKEKSSSLSFTTNLLDKAGDVSDLLGSFLDDRISLIPDQDAAMALLKSFVSVKGTKRQLNAEEAGENAGTLGKTIDEPVLLEMIQELVHLRILRDKDQYGKYELRHDSLAKKIFEKFTIIEKELIEIRQFIDTAWNSWQKRKVLISAEDLDYISPYESKLRLTEEISDLIARSKRELIRKRHLRRNLVGGFGIALILVLSAFSLWALKERNRAQEERNRAQDLKNKALAENFNYKAKEVAVYDPTKALRLTEYALSLDTTNQVIQSNVQKLYSDNTFYSIVAKHKGKINSVAFSPDGTKILTGSDDRTACLSDLQGNLLHNFKGHSGIVNKIAFSPDGTKILTGSEDRTAILWNIEGKPLDTLKGHRGGVSSVAFSPDGQKIFTASADSTGRLWDLQGNTLQIFKKIDPLVRSVAFSPDGRKILTGSKFSNIIRLYDLKGNEIRVFKGHSNYLQSVAFSPDGQRIISGSEDQTAILWDMEGNKIHIFTGFLTPVATVAFSPDGLRILTGTIGGVVQLWDLDGKEIQALKGHTIWIYSAVFSPDGSKILTGSGDNTARIWDLQETLPRIFKGHTGGIRSVASFPDGQKFITGSDDRTVRIWDTKEGSSKAYLCSKTGYISSIAISPDGLTFLTGSVGDNIARLWDLEGHEIGTFKGHSSWVRHVEFSPDGLNILTASADGTARLWERNGKTIQTFQSSAGAVFSPDGHNILTISGYGTTVRLWDRNSKKFSTSKGYASAITSVAFSPQGNKFLTSSSDHNVRLWDLQGNPLTVYRGHKGIVPFATFSPDGTKILSGSWDPIARLWDLNGTDIQIFAGVKSYVLAGTFLPDGRKVLLGTNDGTAYLYPVKMPYLEYEKKYHFEELSVSDKLNFAIYQFDDVIRSENEKELLDAAEYYKELAALKVGDEKAKSLDYVCELYKLLEKNHPDSTNYLL